MEDVSQSPRSLPPLHERCHQTHQDWKEAEFARMVHDYGATVNTISGSVGPLYYCTRRIKCKSTQAMVDSGLSVTILNFSTFHELGKGLGSPPSALKPPDVPLHDYSQRPIPVGGMVELEINLGTMCHNTCIPVCIPME